VAPSPKRGGFGALDLSPILGRDHASGGEYLTVTVTTPDTATRGLPVLVFVHGGGLISGTGQADLYDAAAFARDGIVVVTLNYRLGAPGWLHLPDAPDNRGLLDVLAALRWVAQNIHSFGGDPGRVTVAGQSAGAMLVACLLALPATATDGLFHRAISQSGNGLCAFTTDQAALITTALCAHLGLPRRTSALADIPDQHLIQALAAMPPIDHAAHGILDPSLGNSPFKAVIDGDLLAGQPADVIRATRRSPAAELLIGSNTDEANLYLIPRGADKPIAEHELHAIAARRSHQPHRLIARYRNGQPDASPTELANRIITDLFNAGSEALASAHTAVPGSRTFAYEFAWPSPAYGRTLGACHCLELPFVFETTDQPALYTEHGLLGPERTEAITALASRTHAAWVSFITHGDPGWSPIS
jgi:para-nitrobenzyl esterase